MSAGLPVSQLAGSLGQAYVWLFLGAWQGSLSQCLRRLNYLSSCLPEQAKLGGLCSLRVDETRVSATPIPALDVWQLGKQDYAEFKTFNSQEAAAYPLSQEDRAQIEINRQRVVVGTLDQVKQQLDDGGWSLDLEG